MILKFRLVLNLEVPFAGDSTVIEYEAPLVELNLRAVGEIAHDKG